MLFFTRYGHTRRCVKYLKPGRGPLSTMILRPATARRTSSTASRSRFRAHRGGDRAERLREVDAAQDHLRPRSGAARARSPSRPLGPRVELTGAAERITALGVNMVPHSRTCSRKCPCSRISRSARCRSRDRWHDRTSGARLVADAPRDARGSGAATLSGGQRQMLARGRALMSDPHVLILDEPSAGLAPEVLEEVFARIEAINAPGVSMLMVEQRARQCLAMAHYGYVLDQGRNRLEGRAQALLADPEVVRSTSASGAGGAARDGAGAARPGRRPGDRRRCAGLRRPLPSRAARRRRGAGGARGARSRGLRVERGHAPRPDVRGSTSGSTTTGAT